MVTLLALRRAVQVARGSESARVGVVNWTALVQTWLVINVLVLAIAVIRGYGYGGK